jgi:hypothetical protein
MLDLLKRFADRMGQEEGEAMPEFLLALALGRLRLTKADTRALCTHLLAMELPPLLAALRYWIDQHFT